MGIRFIGQLAALDRGFLVRRFGKSGEHLFELSRGIDDRPVVPEEGYKSIGHETTFEHDTEDVELLHDTLLALTEKVAQRLRAHDARARTITVKFREADFTTYTRRVTFPVGLDTSEGIFPAALKLMRRLVRRGVAVRLIGVYGSNLESSCTGQLLLFGSSEGKDRVLASAIDDITRRFGNAAITRASLVHRPGRKSGINQLIAHKRDAPAVR
jgi:DNA polymerase-4